MVVFVVLNKKTASYLLMEEGQHHIAELYII